jgi:hypothetical protein
MPGKTDHVSGKFETLLICFAIMLMGMAVYHLLVNKVFEPFSLCSAISALFGLKTAHEKIGDYIDAKYAPDDAETKP